MPRKNVLSADNQQGRLSHRLDPWYVSGFVDGEGSFHIAFYQDTQMKTGWKLIPEFHVSQNSASKYVLQSLVTFFGCGYVKENHRQRLNDATYVFVVRDREDLLNKIIPFFEKHPLQTEKRHDYRIFSGIVKDMIEGKHRTQNGLQKLISQAYSMNGNGRYRKRQRDEIKPSETIRQTPTMSEKI